MCVLYILIFFKKESYLFILNVIKMLFKKENYLALFVYNNYLNNQYI